MNSDKEAGGIARQILRSAAIFLTTGDHMTLSRTKFRTAPFRINGPIVQDPDQIRMIQGFCGSVWAYIKIII